MTAVRGWAIVCQEGVVRDFFMGSRLDAKRRYMGEGMKPYAAVIAFDKSGARCLPATVHVTTQEARHDER